MPQLVKGGKHAFGWSRVSEEGRIIVPPEAAKEYGFAHSDRLVLVPGSRTSGGFGLGSAQSLAASPLGGVLSVHPEPAEFRAAAGGLVEDEGRPYCWVELRRGRIRVRPETLARYGISVGDRLLVIRGSGLALGFAVRGPIVEEAKKHPELAVFEEKKR